MSTQRWRPGTHLGITGPRKAIVPVGPLRGQGPLTRFSCPPAALAVVMATVALEISPSHHFHHHLEHYYPI